MRSRISFSLSFEGFLKLETIDVVPQQRRIQTYTFCKLSDIDFRMLKKEPLKCGWFSLFIRKTLETHSLIKFAPVNTYRADFIFLTLLSVAPAYQARQGIMKKILIPQERLTISLAIVTKTVQPFAVKPYLKYSCLYILSDNY